jgi:starch synthase
MFHNSKVVYSLYNDHFTEPFSANFDKKILMDGLKAEHVTELAKPDFVSLSKLAMRWSDAVVQGTPELHPDLDTAFKTLSKPTLSFQSPDDYVAAYDAFYDEAVIEESVLAE